jgi:hypothetical protein
MDGDLIPPSNPNEGGDQGSANDQPGEKGTQNARQDFVSANINIRTDSKPSFTTAGLLFLIIEALALVLWQLAEGFHGYTCVIIHWLSLCGFAAGPLPALCAAVKPSKRIWIWVSYLAVFVVLAINAFIIWKPQDAENSADVSSRPLSEDPYSGVLEPSNDPLPFPPRSSVADFPPNSVFLFGGTSVINLGHSKIPCIVSYKSDCVLTLEIGNNAAFISGRFFDEDGKLVAELTSNRFDVALPPTTFKVSRPNKSTLIVRDSRGEEILNLKYISPSAFEMAGIIRLPNKDKLTITREYIEAENVARRNVHRFRGAVIAVESINGMAVAFGF